MSTIDCASDTPERMGDVELAELDRTARAAQDQAHNVAGVSVGGGELAAVAFADFYGLFDPAVAISLIASVRAARAPSGGVTREELIRAVHNGRFPPDRRPTVMCPSDREYSARILDSVLTRLQSAREGDGLAAACKPWEHCVGDPPEWDSPLYNVFVAGMLYSEKLLCDVVGVKDYEPGDGSEDFDQDASTSLLNILKGAGLYEDENGTWAKLSSSLREFCKGNCERAYTTTEGVARRTAFEEVLRFLDEQGALRHPQPDASAYEVREDSGPDQELRDLIKAREAVEEALGPASVAVFQGDRARMKLLAILHGLNTSADRVSRAVTRILEEFPALDAPARPVADGLREAALAALADFDALLSDSEGVYGLHRNGDPAPWSELIEGGRFEEWTTGLSKLRAALAAHQAQPQAREEDHGG